MRKVVTDVTVETAETIETVVRVVTDEKGCDECDR